MGSEDVNVVVFDCALDYLNGMKSSGVSLEPYWGSDSPCSTSEGVFERFVVSAQNYQSMPNIIGITKNPDRKKAVEKILHNYDIDYLKSLEPNDLYAQFCEKFEVKNADSKRNSWLKWRNAIVDSAQFLSEFKDYGDFEEFVNRFDYNVHTRMALPLLIGERISGIGFALACDMLKELGYQAYPKPDVNLMQVFEALGLSDGKPLDTFQAIVKIADVCSKVKGELVTPYNVDKVFWLICSGNFYFDKKKVKSKKADFIEYAKEKMSKL